MKAAFARVTYVLGLLGSIHIAGCTGNTAKQPLQPIRPAQQSETAQKEIAAQKKAKTIYPNGRTGFALKVQHKTSVNSAPYVEALLSTRDGIALSNLVVRFSSTEQAQVSGIYVNIRDIEAMHLDDSRATSSWVRMVTGEQIDVLPHIDFYWCSSICTTLRPKLSGLYRMNVHNIKEDKEFSYKDLNSNAREVSESDLQPGTGQVTDVSVILGDEGLAVYGKYKAPIDNAEQETACKAEKTRKKQKYDAALETMARLEQAQRTRALTTREQFELGQASIDSRSLLSRETVGGSACR